MPVGRVAGAWFLLTMLVVCFVWIVSSVWPKLIDDGRQHEIRRLQFVQQFENEGKRYSARWRKKDEMIFNTLRIKKEQRILNVIRREKQDDIDREWGKAFEKLDEAFTAEGWLQGLGGSYGMGLIGETIHIVYGAFAVLIMILVGIPPICSTIIVIFFPIHKLGFAPAPLREPRRRGGDVSSAKESAPIGSSCAHRDAVVPPIIVGYYHSGAK